MAHLFYDGTEAQFHYALFTELELEVSQGTTRKGGKEKNGNKRVIVVGLVRIKKVDDLVHLELIVGYQYFFFFFFFRERGSQDGNTMQCNREPQGARIKEWVEMVLEK